MPAHLTAIPYAITFLLRRLSQQSICAGVGAGILGGQEGHRHGGHSHHSSGSGIGAGTGNTASGSGYGSGNTGSGGGYTGSGRDTGSGPSLASVIPGTEAYQEAHVRGGDDSGMGRQQQGRPQLQHCS